MILDARIGQADAAGDFAIGKGVRVFRQLFPVRAEAQAEIHFVAHRPRDARRKIEPPLAHAWRPLQRRDARLRVLAKVLLVWQRAGMRGHTRLTYLLARRFPSLQAVPILLPNCPPLFVDLRQAPSHQLLQGTPWSTDPWDAGERVAMRGIVRPGDVVFDIGANIGFHSILLADLIGPEGRLYAFEPNPELLPALRRTAQSRGNAEVFGLAVSDEQTTATLYVPEYNLMASLANWTKPQHSAGEVRAVTIETRRLDDLIASGTLLRPDFLKCDVEGAELKVFRGALDVLDRADAPIVHFEANEGASRGFGYGVEDARSFLAELRAPRFRFFQIESGGHLVNAPANLPSFSNIVAVPEARLGRVELLEQEGA